MTQQKPNPSAAADKPLSKKLEQIREAIFVWDKWLDKLNDAINEAKKLEAQQTDTLSELRTQIEGLLHYSVYRGNIDESEGWDKGIKAALKLLDSAQTAKKEEQSRA